MSSVYDDMLGAEGVTSKYDAMLDAEAEQKKRAAAGAIAVAQRTPTPTAEVVDLATRTRLPASVVSRNLDTLRAPKVDYDKLLNESPLVSEWISDPDNAVVAHDDLPAMSNWEWMLRAPQTGLRQGSAMVELGKLGTKAMREGLTDVEERRILELNALSARPTGADNFWSRAYVGGFKAAAPIGTSLLEATKAGLPTAMAAGGAAALYGQLGPQVAAPEEAITVPVATWAGFRAGAAAGAYQAAHQLEAGNAFLEFRAIEDVDGKPIDPRIAALAAESVGAVNGAIELGGLGVLARSFPGGQKLFQQFTRKNVKEVLRRPNVLEALGKLTARFGVVWSAEVAQEVAQEATTILAAEISKSTAGGEFELATREQIQERLVETAKQSAAEFAFISILGPGSQFVADASRSKTATERQKAFEAIASADSKLRDRAPAKFREFVAKATENGPLETIYIPADKFVAYFQSQNVDPAEALNKMPEVAKQLDVALAAGHDLAIPMADFAAYIAPSEHYKGLAQDLRFNQGDMTLREAEAWQANAEALGKELEKQAKGEKPGVPDQAVFEDVRDQLVGAGMEPATAERNATLVASVFRSLGERTGESAKNLYDRYGLKIQRGAQPGTVEAEVERIVADDNLLTPIIESLRTESPPEAEIQPAMAAQGELEIPTAETPAAAPESETPTQAQPIEAGPARGVAGRQGRVRVADKYEPVQWAVMDAATLAPTFEKAENQYRDRNRAAAQAQVQAIAKSIDFELLGDSPLMDYGAPTIAPDGRVVGGNGRLAAIRMAYEGGGKAYRDALVARAQEFGLTPGDVEGIAQPVLVRILDKDVDVKAAAIASNEGGALQMSALETAKVDAERVGELRDFEFDDSGGLAINRSMTGIRRWVGQLPAQQRGAITDAQGALSAEGVRRLQNAILYRAYGDSPTLARLVDSVDPGSRNIAAALMRAAPGVAELRDGITAGQRYPLDPSQDIQDAVEKLIRIRESGQSVDEALRQQDVFGKQLSDEAEVIVRFMGANLRSSRTMADFVTRYLAAAERAGSPQQGDIFGEREVPSKLKLWDEAAATATSAVELTSSQSALFQGARGKPKYTGKAFRAGDEFGAGLEGGAPPDASAADVIENERERGVEFDLNDEQMAALANIPARDVMWVGRSRKFLMQVYGPQDGYAGQIESADQIQDVSEDVKGGTILVENDGGALVLLPHADTGGTLFQAPAPKPWRQYLDEWTPEPSLTPEQKEIESRFMAWIQADPERAITEYAKLEDAEGGKVISADVVRELSPDYMADRTLSVAVQEPASALTKALYARRLLEPLGPGEDAMVLFSAGGMGAGKSSGIRKFLSLEKAQAHIIFDSNMGNFRSGMAKIDQAFAAGHEVLIVYTDRELEDAFRVGFLGRAHRQEQKYGTGRTAPLDVFLETHFQANKANREFAAALGDNQTVKFLHVINDVDRTKSRLGTLAQIHLFDDFQYNNVRDRLLEIVAEERQAGRISERIATAVLASEIPRSRSQAGAGDRGKSQAQRDGGAGRDTSPAALIADAIRRSGIDIQTATPADVRAAIAGAEFQQSAVPTDTPAFKAWFGDSKVVDENGEPLVVYHGTGAEFNVFDASRLGQNFDNDVSRTGFFFVPEEHVADEVAGFAVEDIEAKRPRGTPIIGARVRVIAAYLSLQNPIEIDGSVYGATRQASEELGAAIQEARAAGHDGAIIRGWNDGSGSDIQYVAFRPEQIKSVGNRGTFDPSKPSILEQAAFHGSPYDFDRFSLDKIGTGEGAQAFGWGLYFAENEEVAGGYSKLGRHFVEIHGKIVDARTSMMSYQDGATRAERFAANAMWRMRGDKAAAIESLTLPGMDSDEKEAVRIIREDDVTMRGGSLYQVEIPDGAVGRMLIGDELLGRQPPAVLRAIRKIVKDAKPQWTGFDAYEAIANKARRYYEADQTYDESLGDIADQYEVDRALLSPPGADITAEQQDAILSAFEAIKDDMKPLDLFKVRATIGMNDDQLASVTLNELGIPGIRFFDQQSRGRTSIRWRVENIAEDGRVIQSFMADDKIEAEDLATRLRNEDGNPRIVEIPAEPGTRNLVVFDDAIVEITHKDGSPVTAKERADFLQSTMGGPRGATSFGPDRQFTISLFETADLSTILHESGHFYLEVLRDIASRPDAPQQIRDDFDSLLAWFGVDGGIAAWNALSIDEQRPFHEQFARGFEAYLYEGRAPNAELQSLFARFRAWLVSIYRSVERLNVSLNPQVRAVFDRLVATDDEIRAARESQNYVELFTDAEAAGYSETEFAAYRGAVATARTEAEERLTQQVLAELTREQKAWWAEERAKVVAEVTAEAHANPVYRALAFLQRGTNPDGTPIEGVEPVKLNRAALIDQYGKDFLKTLPRPYVYAKEGGVAPDVVAGMFGFDSGDAMVQAIVDARPMREAIETTADERMRARHGEALLDGSLVEKAMDAVHNDRQADLLAAELKALRRLERQVGPALRARELSDARARRAEQANLPDADERRVITRAAEQAIAGRRIRDINPHTYRVAEARASRLAFEAAGKKDYTTAYMEKRKQLLNHELYRAAQAARQDADKIRDYMRGFEEPRKRAALGKAGGGYLEQIDDLLTRFDFRRISVRAGEKRLALAAWVEDRKQAGLEINLPAWLLDESKRLPYKELTYEELLGVRDAVVNIDHLARLKNRLLASQDERDFEGAVDGVVASIDASHKRREVPFEFAPDWRDKIAHGMKEGFGQHTKMEFLFNWLDGNTGGLGPVWRALFKPLADAETREQAMHRAAREALQAIFSRYTKQERWAMFHRKVFAPEIGKSMNKATLLAVALNVGNQYNRDVLLKGYKWSDAQLRALLTRLDDRDWETVQMVWDHIDSYWPEIAKLQKDLTGLTPEKVERLPFQAPTGRNMAGGYYPIVYDSRLAWRQKELDETAAVTELYGGAYTRVSTRHGHTIERTNSGGKAIKLDLAVMGHHVVNVIHDLTHRRALLDVDRLVTDDRVQEAIEQTAGREMYGQLRPWLKSIAADFRPHMTVVEGALNHLRAGGTVVAMGLKLTTALVQPLGYFQSVEVLGPKYSGIGLREVYAKGNPVKSLTRARAFAFERSEQIRNRMHTYDRDVRDAVKGMTAMGEEQAMIRRGWFFFTGLMDMSVALPTWHGAYRKAMDGEARGIQAGDERAAIDYADSILRTTQSAGGAKDLAMIQAGHPLLKVFTTFYSYFNVLFNLFARRFAMTNFRRPSDYPRFVASMVALWFIPAVLSEIVAGRGPDDDEDWEDYVKRSWWTWASYPLQSIAFVRDIIPTQYGYDGPPAIEGMGVTATTLSLADEGLDDDEELTRADVKAAVLATSYWGHLPGRQMWISGSYLYDWATGEEDPESVAEVLEGLAFARKRQ